MSLDRLVDILIASLPMLLLIGAWYFFMRRMGRATPFQGEYLARMDRQTAALERIAKSLEEAGARR